MQKVGRWLMLGLMAAWPVWADIGFRDSSFVIAIEVTYDPGNAPDRDTFQFSLKRKGQDPKPLSLNKIALRRDALEKDLARRLKALEKSPGHEGQEDLLNEFEAMLVRSFWSKYGVMQFSIGLVDTLRSIDPQNAASMDQIEKKLAEATPPKPHP